jgi:hypothetical protein
VKEAAIVIGARGMLGGTSVKAAFAPQQLCT